MKTRDKRDINVLNKNDYSQIIKSSVKKQKIAKVKPTKKINLKPKRNDSQTNRLNNKSYENESESEESENESENESDEVESEKENKDNKKRNNSIKKSSEEKGTSTTKKIGKTKILPNKTSIIKVDNNNDKGVLPSSPSTTISSPLIITRRLKKESSPVLSRSANKKNLVIKNVSENKKNPIPKKSAIKIKTDVSANKSGKKRKLEFSEKVEQDNENERKKYLENKGEDQQMYDDEEVDQQSVASSFEEEFDDFENGFHNIRSVPICKHLSNISFEKPRKKLFDPSYWKCEDCCSDIHNNNIIQPKPETTNAITKTRSSSTTTIQTNPAPSTNVFICLTCGFTSCASSKKKHLTLHYKSTSHPLFLDLNSKFCYCFNCNAFIENDNSKNEVEILRQISYNSSFNLLKSRFDSNEKMIQDDIEETALNHFEMSLTRKFFNIWKSLVEYQKEKEFDIKINSEIDGNKIQDKVLEMEIKDIILNSNIKNEMTPLPGLNSSVSASTSSMIVDNDNDFKIRSNIKTRFGKKNIENTPMPTSIPILSESEGEGSNQEIPSTPHKTSNRNYSSTYLMSKVASSPVKQNKIIPGVTGLRNLGNTCFMNTILQALSNIPEFRTFFVEYLSEDESNKENNSIASKENNIDNINLTFRQSTFDCLNIMQKKGPSQESNDLSFTKQLRSLFRLLWAGRWTVVTPHLILESVWKHITKFRPYQQQDAQEFLSYLLDHISGELNPKQKLSSNNHVVPNSKPFRSFSSRKMKKITPIITPILNSNTLNIKTIENNSTQLPDIPNNLRSSLNNLLTTSDNIRLESLEDKTHQQREQHEQKNLPHISSILLSVESESEAQKPPSTPPDETLSHLNKDRNVPEPMVVDSSDKQINNIDSNNNNNNDNDSDNNNIDNNLNDKKEEEKDKETIISKIFQGKLKSEIICLNCNTNVSRIEPFLELTLDIPFTPPKITRKKRLTKKQLEMKANEEKVEQSETITGFNLVDNKCELEDCIKFLVKQEDLNGKIYLCEHCESKQNAKKKFSIETLPNVLCIVLKRFSYHHHYGSKISTQVRFPFELNLTNFINQNNLDSQDSKDIPNNQNNSEYNYELLNVINHHGSGLSNGHYTAYCFNDKQEIWVHYNDTKTTIVEAQDVIEASQSNAYILFYQKK